MMKGLIILVIKYVYGAFAVDSIDNATCIYSNLVSQTWLEAVDNCKGKGGNLVSYVTGIGKTLDELYLKRNIRDVWTADYAWKQNSTGFDKLCGFDYLNSSRLLPDEELFGNCNIKRNYLCKTTTNTSVKLGVLNSTRENAHCNKAITKSDFAKYRSNIIPGYYWTKRILNWTTEEGISLPRGIPVLCGAFKKTVGKYFIECARRRFSLCMVTDLKDWSGTSDKLCFNVSDRNNTIMETETQTEQEHDSDIGVKVGVPVAILLMLICGGLITIYLSRRYKCWKSRKNENDNGSAKPPSSTTFTVHENGQQLNDYGHTVSNSEYATVNKNKRPHDPTHAGNFTKGDNNRGQRKATDDITCNMNSYCYAVTNKDGLGNAKEIQTAEYSFATEVDEVVGNAEIPCNVAEEVYDISGKAESGTVNKSSNIYNTLQSGEYDSSANVLKHNHCNNVYGVPQNAQSESVYDSAKHGSNPKQPDNIYN